MFLEHDDIVVERLRNAGAIVIGKSNATEFGFGAHGNNPLFPTTLNPWDLTRGPGGSSAGSAAAVAAGVCALSIGSDGGGSIRIPASLCGLVGVKASMGRVPLWPGCRDETLPGVSGWESIEHVGPITRSVADAALMLSVIAGPDRRDRWSLPAGDVDWLGAPKAGLKRGLKALYWPRWRDQPIEPAVSAAVTAAVEAFCARLRRRGRDGPAARHRHRFGLPNDHRAGDRPYRPAPAGRRKRRTREPGAQRVSRHDACRWRRRPTR